MNKKIKQRNKSVTAKQFIRMNEKIFGIRPNIEQIEKLRHGAFLGLRKNLETKIDTRYFLKKIWITKFNMKYSCHKKFKSGGELIISSFPLSKKAKELLPK